MIFELFKIRYISSTFDFCNDIFIRSILNYFIVTANPYVYNIKQKINISLSGTIDDKNNIIHDRVNVHGVIFQIICYMRFKASLDLYYYPDYNTLIKAILK